MTISIPDECIEIIKGLVGKGGVYPSRSELIRAAVREYLFLMGRVKNTCICEEKNEDITADEYIKLPVDKQGFRVFKVLRKLESPDPDSETSEASGSGSCGKKPLGNIFYPELDYSKPRYIGG